MRSGVLGTLVGVMLVYIAASVFIPSDTYSTARWYDMLGINNAIAGQVSWFSALNPILVSREAAFFSLFISVANIALAWQAAFGGYWYVDDPDSSLFTVIKGILTGKARKLNLVKVAYFVALLLLTVFETMTGTEFRQKDPTTAGALKAAAVAFVVENAGSDWSLTAGFGMILAGVLQVYDAYILGRDDIGRIRSTLKRHQAAPQSQPHKGQPHGGQNGNGKPQHNPIGQPVRPQNGNGHGGQTSHQTPHNGGQRHDRNGNGRSVDPAQHGRPPGDRNRPATPEELDALFNGEGWQ